MSPKKFIAIAVVVLAACALFWGPATVRAAGEAYSLSASPGWTTEGNSAGVGLGLSVTNAQFSPPATYTFNWTVTDPSGKSTSATKSTLSTTPTWMQSATYPTDFGASISLVGTYKVNVAETLPTINASVAKTQFQIGITTSPTYQRYSLVTMVGSGYLPSTNVTVSLLLGKALVSGFPVKVNATMTGIVSLTWATYPNSPLGTYNVTISGKTTSSKVPQDSQLFILYPTNTTISQPLLSASTLTRSQTLRVSFNVSYPNGTPATTGTAQLQLTEPGGITSHVILSSYDITKHSFTSYYSTTLASTTGTWTVRLGMDAYDDGYGNGGPLSTVTSSFIVQSVTLTITTQPYGTTYSSGGTVPIGARVVVPGGGNFTQGTVNGSITNAGKLVAGPISLVYDQTQGMWTGSYKVAATDPSGTWLLTLDAGDPYGNSGMTTSSFNVNVPGPPGPPDPLSTLTSNWAWLVLILAAIGIGFGILILRRRGATHREVKLDLHAIHQKAEEVKSDDFLQSVQAQLKRRTDQMAKEKRQERHD